MSHLLRGGRRKACFLMTLFLVPLALAALGWMPTATHGAPAEALSIVAYLPAILRDSGSGLTPSPTPTPTATAEPSVTPPPGPTLPPPSNEWSMSAANPQRTSWTAEQVKADAYSGKIVDWYRPIEAYIPENVQIVAANGLIYIATARGLYALDAASGAVRWRFDTELPLGNSPTVFNGVVYVGGFDRKLHALDAATGAPKWSFDGAQAGYRTNPLVLKRNGKVIIYVGNRDGTMYAVEDQGTAGNLLWSFQAGGPILLSAAANRAEDTIYFAAEDNYAYALNADTGSKVWQSTKLPGEGFQSYWPVLATDPDTNKEYVLLVTAPAYRMGLDPGTGSIDDPQTKVCPPSGCPYDNYDRLQKDALFFDKPNRGSPIGPAVSVNQPWTHGKTVIDGSRISNYLEDNPAQDKHLHKPWRRVYLALDTSDGSEYTQDVNHNGYPEYAPIAFWGTRSGARYPPIFNPADGILYQGNVYSGSNATYDIPQGLIMGWKMGTPYLSLIGGAGALDEPNAISGGGSIIYRTICCDRVANWFDTVSNGHGTLFDYTGPNPYQPKGVRLVDQAPGYDVMWWGVTQYTGYPTATGGYGGSGKAGSPHNGKNGVYQSHGDQNPVVPYGGRLYLHRSNAIIAFGTGSGPGKLPLLTINPISDSLTPPSATDLKARLATEVQKMIAAGNLRPGYYNSGQAAFPQLKDYFNNPGDTVYTLALAYPYLDSGLQSQVKVYLQTEFNTYFDPVMYARRGWSEGAPREAEPMPPEVAASMAKGVKSTWVGYDWSWQYPPHNFYAMWKYVQLFPGDAPHIYGLAKSKLQVPVPTSDGYLKEFTWEQNAYIAGYIGFLNLQDLAGMGTTDGQLKTQVTNELNRLLKLRATTFTGDTPYVNCSNSQHPECLPPTSQYYNRAYNISRNFIFLTPELGDYLSQNALTKVKAALADYAYVAPYWFVSRFEATEDEGVVQPLYDVPALFQAKAYILKDPYSELVKYLDAPAFQTGDLFYIQNLAAALAVAP